MTNIFWVFSYFAIYYTSFEASKITAKYEIRGKLSHIAQGYPAIISL